MFSQFLLQPDFAQAAPAARATRSTRSTRATRAPRATRATLRQFLADDQGQDFAEYGLVLATVGVVAIGVLAAFGDELKATFQFGIDALRAARGG